MSNRIESTKHKKFIPISTSNKFASNHTRQVSLPHGNKRNMMNS